MTGRAGMHMPNALVSAEMTLLMVPEPQSLPTGASAASASELNSSLHPSCTPCPSHVVWLGVFPQNFLQIPVSVPLPTEPNLGHYLQSVVYFLPFQLSLKFHKAGMSSFSPLYFTADA